MALFKIAKGSSNNLGNQGLTEGYCWFTPDDGKFYIDAIANNTLTRIPLNAKNADTATKLATGRTLTIGNTGKTFDGSGNVSWSHTELGATVSNTWTAGTTAGPTIKTTVNGVAGTAVAIPSASKTASGIVTTGDQDFNGTKGFGYMARYGRTNTGAATRWVADTWLYNDAGTQVGEFWYDCGDATNITTGQYVLSQYSPNSTANTSTTGKKENYKLPVVASGLTENKNYTIITTKNPCRFRLLFTINWWNFKR